MSICSELNSLYSEPKKHIYNKSFKTSSAPMQLWTISTKALLLVYNEWEKNKFPIHIKNNTKK